MTCPSGNEIMVLGIALIIAYMFMPIVLLHAWISYKKKKPFDMAGFNYWVAPAFLLSSIATVLVFCYMVFKHIEELFQFLFRLFYGS